MKRITRRVVPIILACALAGSVWAQETPKAPAASPTAAAVGRMSIASIDAIKKVLTDLGVPFPAEIMQEMESAPFLGPGTVATDKPLGLLIVAGDPNPIMSDNSMVIAIPMKEGKNTIDDLKASGQVVAGEKDTVTISEFNVRRTADYSFLKHGAGNVYGLSTLTDTIFSSDYKDASNIAVLSFNIDTLRKAAPDAYKDMGKQVDEMMNSLGQLGLGRGVAIGAMPLVMGGGAAIAAGGDPAKPDATPGERFMNSISKVDRFTLAFGQDDKSLHLKSFVLPSPFPAKGKEANRPAFPAGTIFQMHVVYPDANAAAIVETQVKSIPDSAFGVLPEESRGKVRDLLLRAAKINTQSDAISVGFAMKEGHPVFYLVDQLAKDLDVGTEIKDIATHASTLVPPDAHAKVETSTYDEASKKVQRVSITGEAPNEPIVLDEIQNGKLVYITVSDNPAGKYVGELSAAGMNGKSSVISAGAIDLGLALQAMGETGGMPGLTPDRIQSLKKTLAGQGITWTMQTADPGNYLFFDLQVPKDLIRELAKAAMGDAPQPGVMR